MVKKRMAMRMVTIFVALIVCGEVFPGIARGEDLSVNTVLIENENTVLNVDVGNVVLEESKTTSVGITNQSSDPYTVILLLNQDAECTSYYTYTGDNIVSDFQPGDTLEVEVTFTPPDTMECKAVLQITYYGSPGGSVAINFTGTGVEEPSETYIKIGDIETTVLDKSIEIDQNTTSTLQAMVDACAAESEVHGQLTRCVAWTTGELLRAGEIRKQDMWELRKAAAKVEWQTMIQKMRARMETRGSSRGGRRFWWLCRDR
jgi:hypothetical protein